MNQQPDKFFRDKLNNYERPLSPDVWDRISARSNQKSFLWLKVAAAFALLIVAGTLIFRLQPKEQRTIITENVTPDNNANDQLQTNMAEAHPEPIPSVDDNIEKAKDSATDNALAKEQGTTRKSKASEAVEVAPQARPALAIEEPVIVTKEKEALPEIANIQEADHLAQSVTSQDTPRRETVTIVFSAKEVNKKYLTKKTVAKATSDEKEASTLQKLLDKAYDLKHNQDPLGDLRQKKNEILALNFKSGRQRSKN